MPSGYSAAVSQSLTDVDIGHSYTLRFYYALGAFQNFIQGRCTFAVYLDGVQLGDRVEPVPGPVSQWIEVERTLTPVHAEPILSFTSECYLGQAGFLFDGFSLIDSACP